MLFPCMLQIHGHQSLYEWILHQHRLLLFNADMWTKQVIMYCLWSIRHRHLGLEYLTVLVEIVTRMKIDYMSWATSLPHDKPYRYLDLVSLQINSQKIEYSSAFFDESMSINLAYLRLNFHPNVHLSLQSKQSMYA